MEPPQFAFTVERRAHFYLFARICATRRTVDGEAASAERGLGEVDLRGLQQAAAGLARRRAGSRRGDEGHTAPGQRRGAARPGAAELRAVEVQPPAGERRRVAVLAQCAL